MSKICGYPLLYQRGEKDQQRKQAYQTASYSSGLFENFCDRNGWIAVMDKYENRIFSTGVRVVGAENDFYTLKNLMIPIVGNTPMLLG